MTTGSMIVGTQEIIEGLIQISGGRAGIGGGGGGGDDGFLLCFWVLSIISIMFHTMTWMSTGRPGGGCETDTASATRLVGVLLWLLL